MGLIIGNRALQGSPNLPYLQDVVLAGTDTYFGFVFLDRANVPVVPTSIKVELDDLTNSIAMDNGPITLTAAGATTTNYIYPAFTSGINNPWELQLTAALVQMTYPGQGSQICKLKLVFTAVDSVLSNPFTGAFENVIELVASPTVSGTL
jgi:hypothetical protein